ncbi:methyltransferase [Stratiformator vulcanicus]|uniref:methyltransferase n=1 Tax=Stratiformator vulcanicus TaxID=2527980 RepID=UPI002877AF44|nr:methyltransferase [Stratiformator vulcanicus]
MRPSPEKRDRRRRARLTERALRTITPDGVVRHGVFKGLKYPRLKSSGSALFPKLLGSYERELHPLLERICKTPYTDVVDIGCAEGYYAVGLAMRLPRATIHAFDTNPKAARLCRKMAELNGVADRLRLGSTCDRGVLVQIPFRGKSLIVSDCEGYEKTLFNARSVAAIAGHDVLIEVHDNFDPSISPHLRSVFEATHDIEVICSIDDPEKPRVYHYDELEAFDVATRQTLLAEKRGAPMEWFFCRSRAA